jgi:hypothetical protein
MFDSLFTTTTTTSSNKTQLPVSNSCTKARKTSSTTITAATKTGPIATSNNLRFDRQHLDPILPLQQQQRGRDTTCSRRDRRCRRETGCTTTMASSTGTTGTTTTNTNAVSHSCPPSLHRNEKNTGTKALSTRTATSNSNTTTTTTHEREPTYHRDHSCPPIPCRTSTATTEGGWSETNKSNRQSVVYNKTKTIRPRTKDLVSAVVRNPPKQQQQQQQHTSFLLFGRRNRSVHNHPNTRNTKNVVVHTTSLSGI